MIHHVNYKRKKKIALTEPQAKMIWDSFMRAWDSGRDALTLDELEEDMLINKQIKMWLKIGSCPECGTDMTSGKCTNNTCNQNARE